MSVGNKMGKIVGLFVCIIIGIISLFVGFLVINELSFEVLEKLKILSYILISFSVMVAILQYRENLKQNENVSKWNKKQITITQLHNLKQSLNEITKELNNYLNTRRKEPYSVREIHGFFGVIVDWSKLEDSEKEKLEDFFGSYIQKEDDIHNAGSVKDDFRFIFYKPKVPEDIKRIIVKVVLSDKKLEEEKLSDLYYHQQFKDKYDGKLINKSLHNFLSEYEYLATGVNDDIFDIEVIDDLMGSAIIRAYETFELYIKHLREYHHFSTIYIQFENLYLKIKKRRS